MTTRDAIDHPLSVTALPFLQINNKFLPDDGTCMTSNN